MNPIVYIQAESEAGPQPTTLLLTVGEHHFCFGLVDEMKKELYAYGYYELLLPDAAGLENFLESHPILTAGYTHRLLAIDAVESMPVPMEFFREEEMPRQLNTVYGPGGSSYILADPLPAMNLVQVCRLSQTMLQTVQRHLGQPTGRQMQIILLDKWPKEKDCAVRLEFRGKEFRVMAVRNSALQLIQSYQYSTPADVLYIVLKIFRELDISREEGSLILAGFIEKDSAVYRELYKYFIRLEFETLPEGFKTAAALQQYPDHYFSTLLKLAECEL